MFEIQDKIIVITGATGALGGALALSLAKGKAQLVILGRNRGLLDELASKLTPYTKVHIFEVDVMNRSDLIQVRKEAMSKFDRIDVLINTVGGNLPGAVIPDDKSVF